MPWRTIAEWVGFQVVWLACALGAARGLNWPGVVAAALFLAAVLSGRGWARSEIAAVLASGGLGAVAESLLAASGLVIYAGASFAGLAPAWMIALWLAFGGTLPALDALLGPTRTTRSVILAAVVGAVTGPLAYVAGARLGALQWPPSMGPSLLALALLWAMALPLLLHVRSRQLR